jgi:hypothetical protein
MAQNNMEHYIFNLKKQNRALNAPKIYYGFFGLPSKTGHFTARQMLVLTKKTQLILAELGFFYFVYLVCSVTLFSVSLGFFTLPVFSCFTSGQLQVVTDRGARIRRVSGPVHLVFFVLSLWLRFVFLHYVF